MTHQLQAVKIAAKVSNGKNNAKKHCQAVRDETVTSFSLLLSFFFLIIPESEENSCDVVILGARDVISPSPVNQETNSPNFSFSELLMVAFKIIFLLYLHETMILIMGIKSLATHLTFNVLSFNKQDE